MSIRTWFKLGRVSNLPTVWSNVAAGFALVEAKMEPLALFTLSLSISLYYIAGMFLNDAFDSDFDKQHKSDRPIPAGEISRNRVFSAGYGLLGFGCALLFLHEPDLGTLIVSLSLAASIIVYNMLHKKISHAPVYMGIARALIYFCVFQAIGFGEFIWVSLGAAALFSYIVGLTYAARMEHLNSIYFGWPLLLLGAPVIYLIAMDYTSPLTLTVTFVLVSWIIWCMSLLRTDRERNVPKAVVGLIAGISLLDAGIVAAGGYGLFTVYPLAMFALTLLFQRYVKGT